MKRLLMACIAPLLAVSCGSLLVETVDNEGLQEDVTRRSTGVFFTDEAIERLIRANLAARDEALRTANIDVTAHNGVVLLVGQAPSPELKQLAVEVASEASTRIRRIHDEIEITGNTGFLVRSNDAWISTKARALLLTDESVADANIRVVTENGVVFLLGVIDRELGDQAADLISDIRGVARVVKVFEYLD